MRFTDILERKNTDALRGASALMIVFFHVLLQWGCHRAFNIWGSIAVAVFLFLSGYGINESYKAHGLDKYWQKKWQRIILPYILWCAVVHFFAPEKNLQTFLCDLSFIEPTFWFVGHLLKCYFAYWIVKRCFPSHTIFVLALCGFVCLHTTMQVEAEQSFSFFLGLLVSHYKKQCCLLAEKRIWQIAASCLLMAVLLTLLKEVPAVHAYKGTLPYNYILLFIKLPAALFLIAFFTHLHLGSQRWLQGIGYAFYELYIVHMPLLVCIGHQWLQLFVFFLITSVITVLFYLFNKRILPQCTLSQLLFIGINSLFVAKYAGRMPKCQQAAVIAYILFCTLLLYAEKVCAVRIKQVTGWWLWCGCFILVVVGMVVQYHFDPMTIQVDRWSAIHNFLDNLFQGIYPYSAQTHLGGYGSPFPVWQFVHVPFYLFGNVGLSIFAVLVLYIFSVARLYGNTFAGGVLLLFAFSPAFWCEISVRSDLVKNFLLCSAVVNLLLWKKVDAAKYFVLISILIGLFLSTRLITIIPFAILLYRPYLGLKWGRKILVPVIILLTFAVTFLPFLLWNGTMLLFFDYNPFVLQARQGYLSDFLLFIPLFFLLASCWNTQKQLNRNAAVMLCALIAISFIHRMIDTGNHDWFCSLYDITYFNAALPFLCIAIALNQQE